MSAAVSPRSPDEVSLWSEAGVLYRRICLLRLRGHSVEAARLQSTELSTAVGSIRQSAGAEADCEAKLRALFALEEDRVVNASVLAEILLPMLGEPALGAGGGVARSTLVRPPASGGANSRRPTAVAPGIADFIDEMLQQEHAAPRVTAP